MVGESGTVVPLLSAASALPPPPPLAGAAFTSSHFQYSEVWRVFTTRNDLGIATLIQKCGSQSVYRTLSLCAIELTSVFESGVQHRQSTWIEGNHHTHDCASTLDSYVATLLHGALLPEWDHHCRLQPPHPNPWEVKVYGFLWSKRYEGAFSFSSSLGLYQIVSPSCHTLSPTPAPSCCCGCRHTKQLDVASSAGAVP